MDIVDFIRAVNVANPTKYQGGAAARDRRSGHVEPERRTDTSATHERPGFGFANEYDIERKFHETRLYQVAPISTNLIFAYVAEHLLGLPRSFGCRFAGRARVR